MNLQAFMLFLLLAAKEFSLEITVKIRDTLEATTRYSLTRNNAYKIDKSGFTASNKFFCECLLCHSYAGHNMYGYSKNIYS